MRSINRRGFLKTGITGAAGIVSLAPSMISAAPAQQQDIIYRTLGRTGIKVPVISFGVMRADNPNLCKAAYEKGITFFDTANGYQNGNNETMLGELLAKYPRNSFYLATKVKPAGVDKEGKPSDKTTADDFFDRFNTSLSRLKMDFVDILYVHDIRHTDMLDYKPIVNAVKKLKKEGKIKFIGFSTHANEAKVIDAAADSKTWDVILTSYNFKHNSVNELQAAIKKAAKAGIGIVAMKTLAGGGFLDKEKTRPINTTAALKWALSNPDIATAIPGMTEFEHLDLNIKLMSDLSLTDTEKKDLMIARTETGLYCTGCSKCLEVCPKGLPVPDIMRAYMYAYGYSSPKMAYTLLGDLAVGNNPCGDCTDCQVNCTMNFNIREKIADISRISNVPADFLA